MAPAGGTGVDGLTDMPEDFLGYGPVVPFLVCRFALWFRIMEVEDLNSLNQRKPEIRALRTWCKFDNNQWP